jgi:hypothetical protein
MPTHPYSFQTVDIEAAKEQTEKFVRIKRSL